MRFCIQSHVFSPNFISSGLLVFQLPGIDGILDAYQRAFYSVALSGPTYFSEILQQAEALMLSQPCSQQHQNYTIMLILTDGVINDADNTIDMYV